MSKVLKSPLCWERYRLFLVGAFCKKMIFSRQITDCIWMAHFLQTFRPRSKGPKRAKRSPIWLLLTRIISLLEIGAIYDQRTNGETFFEVVYFIKGLFTYLQLRKVFWAPFEYFWEVWFLLIFPKTAFWLCYWAASWPPISNFPSLLLNCFTWCNQNFCRFKLFPNNSRSHLFFLYRAIRSLERHEFEAGRHPKIIGYVSGNEAPSFPPILFPLKRRLAGNFGPEPKPRSCSAASEEVFRQHC